MANLSYGVLGIVSFWRKNGFKTATLWGWSIFAVGAFIGHIIQRIYADDTAPLNYGIFVWLNDLIIPIALIGIYLFRFRISK